MSQNSFPYGMDVAGAFPRYFTTKRAAVMLLIITMIVQPWRFLSQASIFITVLSCITRKSINPRRRCCNGYLICSTLVYFAAGTAIVMSDYWLVRKRMLKVPDLYKGKDGIYWYTGGYNFRCLIALFGGMAPCIPGFILSCLNKTTGAWVQMFQICWFISAPFALILYLGLNFFWPVEGLGVKELLSTEEIASIEVVEGVPAEPMDCKEALETAKKADDSSV
jgi:NCS1 family nucleobase:cation symporter-1